MLGLIGSLVFFGIVIVGIVGIGHCGNAASLRSFMIYLECVGGLSPYPCK